MLPDHRIHAMIQEKIIGFTPYDEKYLNPASVDMTLNSIMRLPAVGAFGLFRDIDTQAVRENHTEILDISRTGKWGIDPGNFALASTNERVRIPNDIVARIEGKSSLGRLGLAVHITAGFIDPGFEGQITLEMVNLSPWRIWLHSNMRIAQIAFTTLTDAVAKPYEKTGHYQGQNGAVESKYRIE